MLKVLRSSLVISFACSQALISCVSRNSTSKTKDTVAANAETCRPGLKKEFLKLENADLPAVINTVPLKNGSEKTLSNIVNVTKDDNISIEICADDSFNTIEVQRISIVAIGKNACRLENSGIDDCAKFPLKTTAIANRFWKVSGLSEAIFGDTSKLEIQASTLEFESELPDGSLFRAFTNGIFIKGMQHQGKSFALVSQAVLSLDKPSEPPFFFELEHVLAGGITIGKFVSGNNCEIFETELASKFVLGTAQFDALACRFISGPGGTIQLRYKSLKISDSNPKLKEPLNMTLSESDLKDESKFKIFVVHHKISHAFKLTLPNASYIAGAAYERDSLNFFDPLLPPENNREDSYFRVKYGSEEWSPVKSIKGTPDFLDPK